MGMEKIAAILKKNPDLSGMVAIGAGLTGLGDMVYSGSQGGSWGGNPITQGITGAIGGATLPAMLGVKDPKKLALYSLLSALGLGGFQTGASILSKKQHEEQNR